MLPAVASCLALHSLLKQWVPHADPPQRPLVLHGCGCPLCLTCLYGRRGRVGPKLMWQSKASTGLFLSDATAVSLQWVCPGEAPGVSSSAVPGSLLASCLLVLYLCVHCHRSNLRCLGLFSAVVFKNKHSACTLRNVLHDTLSDREIYNQIKVVASTAKQLN